MTSPHRHRHRHRHRHHHHLQRFPSSSSRSYSSNSSSSSSSIRQPQPPPTTRSFEQVWNDITNSTPYHQHQHPNHLHPSTTDSMPSNSPPSLILQDFLAMGPSHAASSSHADHLTSLHLRPPATILSLSPSSFDFRLPITKSVVPFAAAPTNSSAAIPTPLTFSDDMGSAGSLGFFPFGGKKRSAEERQAEGPTGGAGDRHHKRMMKNRESAARSRARKQAYTNELEVAVNSLTQENANLRRMHDELRVAMAAQLPTKKMILRTLTAPF